MCPEWLDSIAFFLDALNADIDTAAGMFNQIDPLALPGAGLRHLDFPTEVQSMFEDLFAPGDGANPHVQMEPAPAVPPKPSMVRAYGSEPDM